MMARMRGRTLMGAALTAVILIASLVLAAKEVSAQNDIVSDLTARLVQRGVPVDSIRIASRLPFRIEAIIQSDSAGSQVAPGDPLSVHTVEREVALARSRYSIELDRVKVIIVNRQGESIYWSDVPSRQLPDASPEPSSISNEEAAELVRSRLPQTELHLQALIVSTDANGSRVLTIQFTAESLDAANRDLPRLSPLGTLRLLGGQDQC